MCKVNEFITVTKNAHHSNNNFPQITVLGKLKRPRNSFKDAWEVGNPVYSVCQYQVHCRRRRTTGNTYNTAVF